MTKFVFGRPSGCPLPNHHRTLDHGQVRDADAHAALQTRLAVEGVAGVTPDTAEILLASFGLSRDARRAILIELWQHAFKKLLFRDDHIDADEAEYLKHFQRALGLTDEKISRARRKVPDVERWSYGE
jgi:hypothetical protein